MTEHLIIKYIVFVEEDWGRA